MVLASLLATTLSISPSPGSDGGGDQPPAPSAVPSSSGDEAAYQTALDNLRTAQKMANDDPVSGSSQLSDALTELQAYPSLLAADPEGQRARIMAQLSLARALLAAGKAERAREVMDEAIRTARGDPLPAANFGPGLAALHGERQGVLDKQGHGALDIECKIACRVIINERPTDPTTDDLLLGSYRVWVEARDGSQAPVMTTIELEHDGQVASLDYGRVVDDNPDVPPKRGSKRLMPRWAEVVLMSAGAAAIGTGAALWAIDGRCPGGADPNDVDACPNVYITKTAGIATLAAGGAVLLTGTIMLTVDEVRVNKRRGNQVALTWTLRF